MRCSHLENISWKQLIFQITVFSRNFFRFYTLDLLSKEWWDKRIIFCMIAFCRTFPHCVVLSYTVAVFTKYFPSERKLLQGPQSQTVNFDLQFMRLRIMIFCIFRPFSGNLVLHNFNQTIYEILNQFLHCRET